MEDYKRAGFIGSGNMAEAMARGFMKAGLFTADKITASDVSEERKNVFAKLGIRTVGENPTVLKEADLIVLAVKPQHMLEILEELQDAFKPGHLVISIAAGITTEILEAYTGESPVIRVMPNTPMLLGVGASPVQVQHSRANRKPCHPV
ncbi:pyrroline-5-carboxylate reductase family protein [Planctomycetota bacterium]